jgi:hypothetical protein
MLTACNNCGAALAAADMNLASCRYCGAVLDHHAQTMQKVAEVNAIMRQGLIPGMGLPPQPPGAPPPAGGPVIMAGGVPMIGGQPTPPMTGGPAGGYSPLYVAAPAARRTVWLVVTLVSLSVMLVVLGTVVAMVLAAR